MSLSQAQMRAHIFLVILDKFSGSSERRQEALTEYFLVTMPNVPEDAAKRLAELIPDLMPDLYSKWIDEFSEKLFETVPDEQLQHLCDGSVENNAALGLVFLMFMESERMEKQTEEDLRRYAREHSGSDDMGDLVAAYLRGKVDALRAEVGGAKLQ
ncbi:MAG: hypothetical protein Q7J24_04360 [Desulfomicrobium sp.]|nr:hypothetical protein [Desulfomicrobium sp.]MDP3430172.1 hypothetical protein [Desulfomicrobium sp.]